MMIVTQKKENVLFSLFDFLCVKLFRCLKFSRLNKHKFRHYFSDRVSPVCGCNFEIEDAEFPLNLLNTELPLALSFLFYSKFSTLQ